MKITIIIYPSDLIKGRNDNNVYDKYDLFFNSRRMTQVSKSVNNGSVSPED
jgi:hypothetical protein